MSSLLLFNIVIMVFLVVMISFGIALWVIGVNALTKCQNNESIACPSYSCPLDDPKTVAGPDCGIKPWRIDENGNKVCMTYLAEKATPRGKLTS